MIWNASRDMNMFIKNLKTESVENDDNREVGGDYRLTITDETAENVGANQSVTIAGAESITTGAGRSKAVGGNETSTVGGARLVKAGEGYMTGVILDRELTVGGSMIERTSQGGVSTTCKVGQIKVGGSLTRQSQMGISEDHGKDAKQTIGGSKIEITPRDRALKVDAALTETIGGDVAVVSGDSFIDDADTTVQWTITNALSGTAGEEVRIEAPEAIRIRCGGSLLEITPTSITIQSPSFDLSGGHLQAVSGIVKHN